ncbi:MAG: DNA helicase II [Thiotrichaceae bacterium]|nr:DNA helicase II [Thiotrichaceae bacterium]
MDVSHILDELNENQREAVTASSKYVLVLAGAGSGKTRVLVHRIAWLVDVEQVASYGIMAVTFTNKAAAEMRSRIEALLGRPAGGMWVSTFHSLAHRMLRRYYEEAKLDKNFQIIDSDDQLRLVKRIMKSLELDPKQWPPRQAVWFINEQKDAGLRSQHIDDSNNYQTQILNKVYAEYEVICQRSAVVDFAELLLRSLELIRDNPSIQDHYQQRFKYILVDEFQDTNELQYAWLRLLTGKQTTLFAVGDDDQSIYGWRGAKIENIQDFSRDFPNSQLVKLQQNYRSTGNILKAANALIEQNQSRLGKELWTKDDDGELIKLFTAFNEVDEADFVISHIQKWVKNKGKYSDATILYRSNAQSRVFESNCIEQNIPYRVYGGLRFYERAEIKDALCYIRLTANPNDDSSLERVINHPPRGLGQKTVSVIREYARDNEISMWHACQQFIKGKVLNNRATGLLAHFIALIEAMAISREDRLQDHFANAIKRSGLKAHYTKKEGRDKGQGRSENLDELVNAASEFNYQPESEHRNFNELTAFLSTTALDAGNTNKTNDCVQMMSIHSAKGLEFPLVFITGLEQGLFPHQNSIAEGNLEEERRLCYVAITRACQQLCISYAEQRQLFGQTKPTIPSIFLNEIPSELIDDMRGHRQRWNVTPPGMKQKSRVDTNATVFAIGQLVTHNKFGEGVVINTEGSGKSARINVNFYQSGYKWLIIHYANLRAL